MKKKFLVGGVFLTLALWLTTDRSPIQLLISFIAAGAVPGIEFSFSPYIMFGLAFIGGIALFWMFPGLMHLPDHEPTDIPVAGLKITANTHHPKARRRNRHHSKSKRRRAARQRRLQVASQ